MPAPPAYKVKYFCLILHGNDLQEFVCEYTADYIRNILIFHF